MPQPNPNAQLVNLLLNIGGAIGSGVGKAAKSASKKKSSAGPAGLGGLLADLLPDSFSQSAAPLAQVSPVGAGLELAKKAQKPASELAQAAFSPSEAIAAEEQEKVARKAIKERSEQFLAQGGSPAELIETGPQKPQESQQGQAQQQAQPAQTAQPQQDPLISMLQQLAVSQPQEQGPLAGTGTLGKLLFSLGSALSGESLASFGVDPSAGGGNAQQQTFDNLMKLAELRGKGAKQQQQLALEQFKQDRQDRREVLKNQLKSQGGSDAQANAQIMAMDIKDLVDARSRIALKGPVAGRAGAVLGAFGVNRTERAAFKTMAEGLVFSIGKSLLEQTGRGFTEGEQESVRNNILGASLAKTDKEFFGKLNGVIRQVNNRLVVGAQKKGVQPQLIPSVQEMMGASDQSIGASTSGIRVISVEQE